LCTSIVASASPHQSARCTRSFTTLITRRSQAADGMAGHRLLRQRPRRPAPGSMGAFLTAADSTATRVWSGRGVRFGPRAGDQAPRSPRSIDGGPHVRPSPAVRCQVSGGQARRTRPAAGTAATAPSVIKTWLPNPPRWRGAPGIEGQVRDLSRPSGGREGTDQLVISMV
jgi:hypothetical protein